MSTHVTDAIKHITAIQRQIANLGNMSPKEKRLYASASADLAKASALMRKAQTTMYKVVELRSQQPTQRAKPKKRATKRSTEPMGGFGLDLDF